MPYSPLKKIIIIGNSSGGKSVLARRLGEIHNIAVIHIDSLQYLPGLTLRPHQETLKFLEEIMIKDSWLIDGYGPLDNLEKRFSLADRIIFIDLPLWRHYWWFTKRQIQNLWSRREELPENCNELTWTHSKKVLDNIWTVHTKMRPELMRILNRPTNIEKVIMISDLKTWNELYETGI
jgi:adenylate kinase family enzyme